MTEILRANKIYFFAFCLFLVLGLVLLIVIEQGDAILYFSNHRSEFGDLFFSYVTKMGEEWLYILAIITLLFVRFRYVLLVPLTALLVLIISFITKSIFAHNRPSVFFREAGLFDQINLVDGVTLLNGPTSFPSGHTMSAFAMYGLLALILPRKKMVAVLLLITAVLVGVSRMYLVQHFLKDVVTGAAIGTLLAFLIYYFQARYPYQSERFIDRSLQSFWKKDHQPIA